MAKSPGSAKKLTELREVEEIMTLAISKERGTAEYYENALSKATTDASRRAFALLLEQEREHERRLREELAVLRQEIAKESVA